jgi:hypothetical protein
LPGRRFNGNAALLVPCLQDRAHNKRTDNAIAHVFVTLANRAAAASLRPDLTRRALVADAGVNVLTDGPQPLENPHVCAFARGSRRSRHGLGRPSGLLARAEGSEGRVTRVELGGAAAR